ncbi:hypothetical protein [Streptomyces sp. NPDC093544]
MRRTPQARRPGLTSRLAHAQSTLDHEDPDTAQEALRELSARPSPT